MQAQSHNNINNEFAWILKGGFYCISGAYEV